MTTLRNVFRYVNPHTAQALGRGDNPYAMVNNTDLSDEDFFAQMQALQEGEGSFDYSRERGPDSQITNRFTIRPDSFLDKLNQDYAGSVNYGASPYSEGSPGSGMHLSIDGSKLPQTRYGDISRAAAVDEGTDLRNPNAAYDDPVYGRIAPLMNIKGNDELPAIVQAIMAAMTAGIGGLAAATGGAAAGQAARLGLGTVNAARSLGSGNPLGAAMGMLGASGFVNPQIMQAIRTALAMAQQRGGGKP